MTRFCCKQKEQRRQRMYEKALDACATSPFARGISKWVLAGDTKSHLSTVDLINLQVPCLLKA